MRNIIPSTTTLQRKGFSQKLSGLLDHLEIPIISLIMCSQTIYANFKNAIAKSDLLSQLDLKHNADPNQNYNILSSSLEKC